MYRSITFTMLLLHLCSCESSGSSENSSSSAICNPSEKRCYGEFVQSCNLLGQWEDIPCPAGYSCFMVNNEPSCDNRNQGGSMPMVDMYMGGNQGGSMPMVDMTMGGDQGGFMPMVDMEIVENRPCGLNCPDMEMILIKAGSFMMGSENHFENPIHNVQITNDFYVGKTEVTVGQYRACVNKGACTEPVPYQGIGSCESNFYIESREKHPINCVDWKQARAFAKWIGGDLLTEAQWEYVATAQGSIITYPWGNNEPTCEFANFEIYETGEYCVGSTAPICSTPKGNTAQGVCDMGGNVREWVLDEWHNSYSGAPIDEQAWCRDIGVCNTNPLAYRVWRGGGWRDILSLLASTYRISDPGDHYDMRLGFRVARLEP
jgi:formylglycine-generating enzyme required for sulfatase activity